MIVYELSSSDLDERLWLSSLVDAMTLVRERGIKNYKVHRLTLDKRREGKELEWMLRRRDAYVVKRELVG